MPALCLRLVSKALRCPKISYFRFHFTLMRFILSQIHKVKDESSGCVQWGVPDSLIRPAETDSASGSYRGSIRREMRCSGHHATAGFTSRHKCRRSKHIMSVRQSVCRLPLQLGRDVWMTAQIRIYTDAKIHSLNSTQQKQKRIVNCFD